MMGLGLNQAQVKRTVGMFLCSCAFLSSPALSQENLLELNLDRELTELQSELLSELIVQNDSSWAIENVLTSESFADVCGPVKCRVPAMDAFNGLWANTASLQSATAETLNKFTRGLVIPGEISRDGQDYFVIEPEIEANGTVHGATPGEYNTRDLSEFRAFPLNQENQLTPQDFAKWGVLSAQQDHVVSFWEPKSVPFNIISNDLAYMGDSSRAFAIQDDISQERVTEIVAALRAEGVNASQVSESSTSLIQPVVSLFEGTGANCGEGTDDGSWPFDISQVETTIVENREWLSKLRLPISRALVLVVDTGIGAQLINEGGRLSNFISPKASEILNPLVVYRDLPEMQGALRCNDIDSDEYYWDAIGATGEPKALDIDKCPFNSVTPLSDHRLFPIPLKVGAVDTTTYVPGHGSFVSVLAAGGEPLGTRFPDLAEHLGLRFFKVTRKAEAGSLASVRVESSALKIALKYAKEQRVNVVNLSMKTSDENIINLFNDGFDNTLVVTSAGNLRQDLDTNRGSLPASLRDPNLIVVGALTNNASDPLWANSAYGETVNIAAPGVGIESLDENGGKVCLTGTSAAAPTVSFTAALLYSFGFFTPRQIKDRIFYSASFDSELEGRVEQGRKLDVAAALDVFVDRLTLTSGVVLRGRIVNTDKIRLIQLCSGSQGEPLAGWGGKIDPYYLKSWRRDQNRIVFEDTEKAGEQQYCTFDTAVEIEFQKLGNSEPIPIELGDIESGVLSPFRSALVEDAVLHE